MKKCTTPAESTSAEFVIVAEKRRSRRIDPTFSPTRTMKPTNRSTKTKILAFFFFALALSGCFVTTQLPTTVTRERTIQRDQDGNKTGKHTSRRTPWSIYGEVTVLEW
jgi:hypothetical protein